MDNIYIKLFGVFAILAGIRLATLFGKVPARVRRTIAEYTDSGIVASVVAIFVVTFLLQISRVEGVSMQPTLQGGEYALVNKFTYHWSAPRRGDVIVFRAPDNPNADYIKRVIAVAGETVEVRGGVVRVNGAVLQEPYENEAPRYDFPPSVVPEGHLFVLGDNRNWSLDSHSWGELGGQPFLPLSLVRGKASLILWPLPSAGGISRQPGSLPPGTPPDGRVR